ncbi:cyclic nucleotide-binding domain-containing protein [Hymenobacter sp. BT770]|uniref:cyclic nucleotide-binding domain-containing protein n=1 Tax=Hymenobacter sp. BT770 TaxID=2886942 RepID=UPI001D1171A2|nr:cyclic nucleotide-binding domain-containing protein [Hymenobacter sp. BT770]MCC3151760.1 cyclic nucleotide-binding domain-containing protein [Hymenobacter sp. BT770]MDO3413618.1 cyclic nucleotide-binding domain-containing protein [Hymenobacter sp. BT770]
MISATSLQRLFGIKTSETRTVGLFLLHNFLLGIGSVLVYVAANVLLLEHNPEHSLPLGYIAGALGMMAVGKVYTYFEHHYLLKKLAVRVLLAVVALTGAMGTLVAVGHSVVAAVAIMVGYRIIYLLTNLEFWGVSAVVFDVRQSKRLFSIISSGDMPAKALGALLAALIHGDAQLPVLLGVSFAAYVGALFALRSTLRSHTVEAVARPVRRVQRAPGNIVRQLFGGSELVLAMCLSLVAIAAVLTGVEYMFFINVKHKFHESEDITRSVGWILGLTYLAAMFFKLLVSRQALERYGVQWSLRLLPAVALVALAGFGGVQLVGTYTQSGLLIYFCGLYLLLEVLRRTVFDPVFLVLFQPLAPPQRLAAHTLAKGFYEPLGMGLTGLLFFGLRYAGLLDGWVPFAWMGGLLVLALLFLARTYRSYLAELKEGLSRRFAETAELALPDAALQVVLAHLHSPRPTEVLNAVAWLRQRQPAALAGHAPTLLEHPDERVRLAVLAIAEVRPLPAEALHALALRDPAPAVREAAAQQLAATAPEAAASMVAALLTGSDMAARQGAIRGSLEAAPLNPLAQTSLHDLLQHPSAATSDAALALLGFFPFDTQEQLVESSLASGEPQVAETALKAIGTVGHTKLTHYLLRALSDKQRWQPAADSLVELGPAVVPLVRDALHRKPGAAAMHRLATVLERLPGPASRAALVELAQGSNLFCRAVALRALRHAPAVPADAPVFEHLLREEFNLAAQLLRGLVADRRPALHATVDYELMQLHQRVFGILAQLYDADLVATAQRNVAHAARERQANALEILDNLIPRPIYQGLQALLDDTPIAEKARLFATLTAPAQPARTRLMPAGYGAVSAPEPPTLTAEPLPVFLLRQGPTAFSSWTLSLALRHWQPTEADAPALLQPYLQSRNELLAESAQLAAAALAAHTGQPLPAPSHSTAMSHSPATAEARISALERVVVLKSTALFAQTPENVLSSIVPIMKEVTFNEGEEIFAKGDIGTSLFILHDGQVGIFNGNQQLATFGPGDFFGELALLDAEPRSASAAALSQVLAFRLDQEDFYDLMEERGEVLRNILRMLCQRIRLQNEKMRELAH